MNERYEQFLGSSPGTIVTIKDDSGSPLMIATEAGFEFFVSAEDFKNYYRPMGSHVPERWQSMVTDRDREMVESQRMGRLMNLILSFKPIFKDYDRCRSFVRDALTILETASAGNPEQMRSALEQNGCSIEGLSDEHLNALGQLDHADRTLLISETFAVIPFIDASLSFDQSLEAAAELQAGAPPEQASKSRTAKEPASNVKRTQLSGAKNVEIEVTENVLTVTVDLSQDFGPSKSGKTTIVASTSGNKPIPGREERIGLNIYRQEGKRPAKGRRSEFKNVTMAVEGDTLTLTTDLTKEFGPSKSGRTIIVASTEGNQLVFGREEKIGLNIYRNA
jgi:hypothetical protein